MISLNIVNGLIKQENEVLKKLLVGEWLEGIDNYCYPLKKR